MNQCKITLLVCLLLSTSFSTAKAQITLLEIERELRVEIYDEMSDPFVYTGDMLYSEEFGNYIHNLEVSQGSAISRCSHSTNIFNQGDQIAIQGNLDFGLIQSEPGFNQSINAYTEIRTWISVPSTCSFEFSGQMEGVSDFYIHIGDHDSGYAPEVCDFGQGAFLCTGELEGPGVHQFVVGLGHAIVPQQIESDIDTIEFFLTVALDGVVGTDTSSWGTIKSLYR